MPLPEDPQIQQLLQPSFIQPQKPQRKYVRRFTITLVALVGVVLMYQAAFSQESVTYHIAHTLQKVDVFAQIKHLISNRDKELRGESEGRINILLLGIGGSGHTGPLLTDTIIIASFDLVKEKVALFSIPRDLWVPLPYTRNSYNKINSIYAFAEVQQEDSGGEALSQTVAQVFGIPIHYYGLVDFDGLMGLIDRLDGIEVYVERPLEDPEYPVLGREEAEPYSSRFEHLYIPEGWQNMDGNTALKYARSRHALGVEGSDFSRARRQQKILLALKDKILSTATLLQPSRINALLDAFDNHLATNMEVWEGLRIYQFGKNVPRNQFVQFVFDDGPHNFLEATSIGGAYVLQAKDGNFAAARSFVQNIFNNTSLQSTREEVRPPRIELQNGTRIAGMATTHAQKLETLGYTIAKVGNAPVQTYQKTEVYDLSGGQYTAPLLFLAAYYHAPITVPASAFLEDAYAPEIASKLRLTELSPLQSTDADILVILGQDAL
ncbi:MAG: hypothetical protein COT39_02025 [Parcubacteria group bacterium CG08_land_8_20_14_0_20_48_21]|nr:MAG: hypothetical protein AUK21_04295 [Parcubacteria group bacterium CG2_30_48_51]PIS32913.1 MAG: hypothetical protein COT39_02025 [Parcubacteria group bacterium CG08_land_8_20_14_0_20_48_21]PIW79577.1 MAG: hypothetical protein COZ99_00300 [Parcubacteria group bacterium CG_4_8_14_3_um_filter_48_16]PIY77844.1 MAG: hypothetical protein COY83_03040 [Parcubacteria group bacterium CG_4_10_14_0_8_um_filter_48_154]PIZ77350.1 MAG: hypothetical protein COY03_03175 [bacterium CG_4_10_14_0_2_um_filter_